MIPAMTPGHEGRLGVLPNRGLKDDVPAGFFDMTVRAVRQLRDHIPEYEGLLLGNEIFKART